MFRLFDSSTIPSEGVIISGNQRYLKTKAESILQILDAYFARSSFRLPNNHLLVQILRNLEYSLETPFEKVVESVNARTLYVAKHFNLTSEIDYGKPHKGVFYSHKDSEAVDYLFAKSSVDVNPFDDDRSWTALSPLTVMYHQVTDFHWLPPNGQPYGDPVGYSVVQVDIALLALQYREYCLEMARISDENVYNPNKFIVTRVLPKIYRSHIDHVMINQFMVKTGTIPETTPNLWLPIALPEMETSVKQVVNELYSKMAASRKTYGNTLATLPTIFAPSGLAALTLPSTVATRQSFWLQVLARFPHMEFLTELQGKGGRGVNTSYMSEFKREMGMFLNTKGYQQFKQPLLEEHFLEASERIMKY